MKTDPSDFAYKRVAGMWRTLGALCASQAVKRATDGQYPEYVEAWALLAEGCYWRSTGDMDTYDIPRKQP